MAGQSAFTFPHRPQPEQRGRRGLAFRARPQGLSMGFRRWSLARLEMCESRGWIPESEIRRTRDNFCGTHSCAVRPTAERPGARRHGSRERLKDTITFPPGVSAFLSEITSGWRSTMRESRTRCGARDETTNRPDRSGTAADDSRHSITIEEVVRRR